MKRLLLLLLPFIASAQIDNKVLNEEFVVVLNEYRAQNGLDPVVLDESSIYRAKLQTNYCIKVKDLTHDCPAWFPGRWAENALWRSFDLDAQGCLDQWIESPPHNDNLLLDGATKIGIWGGNGSLDGWDGFYATLVIN